MCRSASEGCQSGSAGKYILVYIDTRWLRRSSDMSFCQLRGVTLCTEILQVATASKISFDLLTPQERKVTTDKGSTQHLHTSTMDPVPCVALRQRGFKVSAHTLTQVHKHRWLQPKWPVSILYRFGFVESTRKEMSEAMLNSQRAS